MQKIKYIIFTIFISINNFVDAQNVDTNATQEKILFVVSNQHTYGDSKLNAANHFSEIVLPYDILTKAGYHIDFVSPKGGAIPIGYLKTSDPIQKKYIYDTTFMNILKNTHSPDEIKASEYKAVYYSGGGAAMFGVPENNQIQIITKTIYNNKGIVSAVCHGTAGLVYLKTKNGNYLYNEKKISGFPDKFENTKAEYYKQFPFSIEKTINQNGGKFSYSEKGWDDHFVIDGQLITGQDPSASASVAQKIIESLKNK